MCQIVYKNENSVLTEKVHGKKNLFKIKIDTKVSKPNSACIFARKQPFQNNEFDGAFIDSIDPNGVAEIGSWKMGMLFLSGTYRLTRTPNRGR